jgi:hypothetical protein
MRSAADYDIIVILPHDECAPLRLRSIMAGSISSFVSASGNGLKLAQGFIDEFHAAEKNEIQQSEGDQILADGLRINRLCESGRYVV